MTLRFATDHLAMVTGDTAKTVDFYTRVMRWPLVAAQRGQEPDGRDYLITAFQGDRWRLEFEEVTGREGPRPQAPGFPHIGIDVGTHGEYEQWKAHLDQCAIPYLETREHNCFFTDPNGLSFQLIVKGTATALQAEGSPAAEKLVQEWLKDR